jgi:hypothetical protein
MARDGAALNLETTFVIPANAGIQTMSIIELYAPGFPRSRE